MSTNLAYQAPLRRPSAAPLERPIRRVEVVPTRSQRRARPRRAYAIIAVAGVFAIIIAQLMLSISVSNGAYQIAQLQNDKADLTRTQESLSEKADVLASPTNLDQQARSLGLVLGAAGMAQLDLSTGKVTGTAKAAKPNSAGASATSYVPNIGLEGVPIVGSAAGDATATASATSSTTSSTASGAPSGKSDASDVASSTPPAVTTH